MDTRIILGALIGMIAVLMCTAGKKQRKKSNEIARQIANQSFAIDNKGKWDIQWPITDATDTVLDKAVYRNGHIRNN